MSFTFHSIFHIFHDSLILSYFTAVYTGIANNEIESVWYEAFCVLMYPLNTNLQQNSNTRFGVKSSINYRTNVVTICTKMNVSSSL
jgi:hypothetical protein